MPGRLQPPARAGEGFSYGGPGFSSGRYPYGAGYRGRSPHREPYRGHDRDRHRDRWRHGWGGSYYGYAPGYVYPYTYPYVIDPGFYDWGATDYSDTQPEVEPPAGQDPDYAYAPDTAGPGYGDAPYPQQQGSVQPGAAQVPPQRQEYHFASSSAPPAASKPLTVIFKDKRPPEKIYNFMISSTSLTDLDGQSFEKIPLDEIDVAATQRANRSIGVDFEVPLPSHD